MHGKNFSRRKWAAFLKKRAVPGSRIAFQEIEVLLCNIKSSLDVLIDREEEERERQGYSGKHLTRLVVYVQDF